MGSPRLCDRTVLVQEATIDQQGSRVASGPEDASWVSGGHVGGIPGTLQACESGLSSLIQQIGPLERTSLNMKEERNINI